VTEGERSINNALARARAHSPFLDLQLGQQRAVARHLASGDVEGALAEAEAAARNASNVGEALRRQRSALALSLAVGDLASTLSLDRVFAELSRFADHSLEAAIAAAFDERTPGEPVRGFTTIALGKLGGGELNYSSDIDVLFLFDPETLPLKPREEPAQAGARIARRVVELLQARTGDGYVFRVDLRLRPSPEVTPIALPVDAAISYYETSALPWERAAFIKARVAAGDRELGRYFMDAIHPFVWRRSLDFGVADEVRSISRRIRLHYEEGQAFGPGFDLKRGRGGIREIEFFVQAHQLIHGGRDVALRDRSTLGAIEALRTAGRIEAGEAEALTSTYRLLRTIEHRVQMVDDQQTHQLPAATAALDSVALLHGLEDGVALLDLLRGPVSRIAEIYDGLGLGNDAPGLPITREALEARLREFGFEDPISARLRVEHWRSGAARSLRTAAARDAFEAMLPTLLAAFGQSPDPARAMNRFEDVIVRLPSGVNFFRLVAAQPELGEVLTQVLAHAPVLADQLGRRPQLLDALIDASAFRPVKPLEELIEDYRRPERQTEDYEQLLDRVRRRVNETRFALGTQLVMARTDPIEAAEGYSRVAEAAIQVLADAAIEEFAALHGRLPGSELVILGLGRLGGEALTWASDLDLIYLFTGDLASRSEGKRPLGTTDYYNRLAPRITAALSVPTAAGPLYQVDTRLRPHGEDGMIAVSFETFERYQRSEAWTWEHMALTRARPIYGSPEARKRLSRLIESILLAPRERTATISDAVEMRAGVARHKPSAGPFDIKRGEGGLIDLEFAIQTLQLTTKVGLTPRLENAITALEHEGLVPDDFEPSVRLLVGMLVVMRLISPQSDEPPAASRSLVARACGHSDWPSLLARHDEARQKVSTLWRQVSAERGER
jgi:[glutamine synthetase] adenylyltransferase / [glutamine synthetase]-adenylyl-L-tyrosine phosphorylase